MQAFLVFASVVAIAAAQYDYSPPQRQFNAGGNRPTYGVPNHTPGIPQGPSGPAPSGPSGQQEEAYTPQTFKHVYVHVAPDEPADVQARTIRVPGGDKHVNIIFVKTPSSSSQQNTEVILPEQDEHKNLVYVLLKKGEATSDVKIRRPAPAPQRKPEVYFIKYADQQQGQQGQAGGQQQGQAGGQQQGQFGGQQGQNGGYPQAPAGISAPAPIRNPSQVPSSGYGVPL